MSMHTAQATTPAGQLAAELLNATTPRSRTGRHRRTFVQVVLDMARAGEWHEMWCLLGDVIDEICDVVIAWFAIVAGVTVVLALGATFAYTGGPVAALAYVLLLIVAVLVWFRWDGGTR